MRYQYLISYFLLAFALTGCMFSPIYQAPKEPYKDNNSKRPILAVFMDGTNNKPKKKDCQEY